MKGHAAFYRSLLQVYGPASVGIGRVHFVERLRRGSRAFLRQAN
jgi:hypothetical protein